MARSCIEDVSTFVLSSVVVGLCALVAVGSLEFSLVIYPLYYIVANAIVTGVLIYRRPIVGAPDKLAASEEIA